ncbi:MAG: cellulase family glycosylhydrolase [Bacteroidota bacterium]|nr:cellulase family glycosylhydrolase [Bacteroidota bacterium]
MRLNHILVFALLLLVMPVVSCSKTAELDPQLSVSPSSVSFPATGGTLAVGVTCNDDWKVTNSATWLQLDKSSGSNGSDSIHLTTKLNDTGAIRSAILSVDSENGQARRVSVSQACQIFPSYNTSPKAPDATGMSSTAAQLIAKINLGINIGNTLELNQWHEPYPTLAYIQLLKRTGFNAVRLPCGWYLQGGKNSTAKIPQVWMDSVKKVVQWCVSNDMYVLLNIHWDGGWLEGDGNISAAKKDSVQARQKAYWEQIATAMRDFDEHLMFASANEPFNVKDDAAAKILVSYHQACIDAVRSTGGHNTYRTIAIQGPDNYIQPGVNFPTDPTPNRLVFEFHNYTPSSFTILSDDKINGGWDNVRFYWSVVNHSTIEPDRNCSYGEETDLLKDYTRMKAQYIDKGIPCIMGEYSAQRWSATNNKFVPKEMDKHNQSVDDWVKFNTKQCKAIGAAPFYWETGGVLDRVANTIKDQRTIDAIVAGGK